MAAIDRYTAQRGKGYEVSDENGVRSGLPA
jgi:hypothetical protein